MGQMCMTDAGTTQDSFILPAPHVGGLSISQDWLDMSVPSVDMGMAIEPHHHTHTHPVICCDLSSIKMSLYLVTRTASW